MESIHNQIEASADAIRKRWPVTPAVGIVLGTGLGNLAEQIDVEADFAYSDLPYFPRSTAVGHAGRLVCGTLSGVPVVAMQGRFHTYEGYAPSQVTLPVRVMNALGIQLLIVSNASGGLNPNYASGDLMVLDDHIDLMGARPLVGVHDERLGPRYPALSARYDADLIEQALTLARRHDFVAHRGIYAAVRGPNYETRSEIRYLRRIGADVVGMSTVPEVIVANQVGLRVLAISTVTNVCRPDALRATTGEAVVAIAQTAEEKLRHIVLGVLALWP